MQFIAGLAVFSILFIIIFVVGLLLVFRKTWLVTWLRANVGICCIFFGLAGATGLYLLADMHALDGEVNLGTVKIHRLGVQTQFIRLDTARLGERDVELMQENWRLRAIQVHWTGLLPLFGITDGVLLYDVQQSSGQGLSQSEIVEHEAVVKVWEFGRHYLQWLPGVHFEFLTTEWFPTDLNTVYDLKVTRAGFTLKDRTKKVKAGTAQALMEAPVEEAIEAQVEATSDAPAEVLSESLQAPSELSVGDKAAIERAIESSIQDALEGALDNTVNSEEVVEPIQE